MGVGLGLEGFVYPRANIRTRSQPVTSRAASSIAARPRRLADTL